ncbi:MAG: two-component regulator propeller domain-containing protein [Saprospiraceae bacterium]|nr:two-component regulator propeller domain-containing protein [Saprospiraceae bacterium]
MATCASLLPAQTSIITLQHLTTEEGLAQDHVSAIAQDRQGYLWFGTLDGLTRFDGTACLVFRKEEADTNSLPDSRISGLCLDPAGNLWISTFEGAALYHTATHTLQRLRLPAPTPQGGLFRGYLSNFSFDAQGMGWAVADSFLLGIDPRTLSTRYVPIPAPFVPECQVYADTRGRVWVTIVGRHLLRFDPATQTFTYMRGVLQPNGQQHPWPMSVGEDREGVVWNADWDQAFYRYDEAQQTFVNYPDSAGIATVFVFEDRPGLPRRVWAGGGSYGLWNMNMETKERQDFPPDNRNPYAHNNTRVYALHGDTVTGIIWIGTDRGVEYYDPNAVPFGRVLLPETPGLNQFHTVTDLLPDPHRPGHYWVSVWGVGLFAWDSRQNTFVRYHQEKGDLYSNEIFDLAVDSEGLLWLATFHGVERFDPNTRQHRHFAPAGIPVTSGMKTLSVTIAPDGAVWQGTNGGYLVRTHPKTGESVRVNLVQHNGRPREPRGIWHLDCDRQGRILTPGASGLLRYDPASGQTQHLLLDNPAPETRQAVQGPDDRLYVGTGKGVYVLDRHDALLLRLHTGNGLLNQNVHHLALDALGVLWISTENGLHAYDTRSGRLNYFNKKNGLLVSKPEAMSVLPGGELFVSGTYSFNLARYDQVAYRVPPPRIAVDAVRIMNRRADWRPGETLLLRPGETVFSVAVSAIQFTQPEESVIAYKLEGFNEDWTETRQPLITYTNLGAGTYTLLIRARNADGVWSAETLRIPLRVRLPFYRSPFFWLALAVLILGGALALQTYRNRMQRRIRAAESRSQALEKQQLINEVSLLKTQVNPHFLFNSLSILSSLVHVNADLSEQFIDRLAKAYRYILEQRDEPLVPLRTELEFIQAYVFLLKIRFDQKFDLLVDLNEDDLDRYRVAPMTLQLLVENAVKHNRMSAAEPLHVHVFIEADMLVVKNRIQRRNTPVQSTGLGLENIRNRYALLADRPVWAGEQDGAFWVKIPLVVG